jgi:excisionase family DNA binding protein
MQLLTVAEAALMLKVSPITVRRYIADGRLEAKRVGRGIRVEQEALERLPAAVNPSNPRSRGAIKGKPTSKDDPLWNIVGIGRTAAASDVSVKKKKYLAEAYATKT